MNNNTNTSNNSIALPIILFIFIILAVVVFFVLNNKKNNGYQELIIRDEDGNVIETIKVKSDETSSVPEQVKVEGYETKYVVDGKEYNSIEEIPAEEKNKTIEVVYEKIPYKPEIENTDPAKCVVGFDADGGNKVASQLVDKGGKATQPDNPSRKNYEFVEWQLNGVRYDFDSIVNEDIVLVAKWQSIKTNIEEPTTNNQNNNTNNQTTTQPTTNNSGGNNNNNNQPIVLTCPNSPSAKTYNGNNQSSGINCPANSTAGGTTSEKNVGVYTQTCIPNNGYTFNGNCNIQWQINHSSSKGTIRFHSNIPGNDIVVVREYNKNEKATLLIPNNWKRSGYVLSGWTDNKSNYPIVTDITSSFLTTNSTSHADMYAVWTKVNSEYGNMVFIGDSYANSAKWAEGIASRLGIGNSYTLVKRPGTGFINKAYGVGDLGGNNTQITFFDLLNYSDYIIAENDKVKYVVIMAGYNDYHYGKDILKNQIITFANSMHNKYPNAKLFLGMVGTDFLDINIETTLLQTTDVAYREAADSLSFVEYIPYTNGNSISNYLRWYADYNDASKPHGCTSNNVTSSCYYWIEQGATGNTFGIHPSVNSGNIIADVASNYIKNHK